MSIILNESPRANAIKWQSSYLFILKFGQINRQLEACKSRRSLTLRTNWQVARLRETGSRKVGQIWPSPPASQLGLSNQDFSAFLVGRRLRSLPPKRSIWPRSDFAGLRSIASLGKSLLGWRQPRSPWYNILQPSASVRWDRPAQEHKLSCRESWKLTS